MCFLSFLFHLANLNSPRKEQLCLLIALVSPALSLVSGSFLITIRRVNESFSLVVLNLFVAAVHIVDGLHVLNKHS